MGNRKAFTITKFLGLNKNNDDASLVAGELTTCNNYTIKNNGDLAERGGGAKLTDPPAAGRLYGFDNYRTNEGSEFLLCAQGTKIYYYNSGWVDAGITVTTSLETRFEQAGFSTNRNIYAVNGTDAVIQITTTATVPAASFVASSPTDLVKLKLHKNRLFGITNRDTVKYTGANAFETWATGTNEFQVAPGVDGYLKSMEIWGDSIFFFKEFGVYVLPNAADANPTTSWKLLKTDALTGTQSPDSVIRTRSGIYYFATDNKVRVISPDITFTSGEYVLGGSGSPVISELLQDYIDEILTETNKDAITATLYKDLYVLNLNSSSATGNENDICLVADTVKKRQLDLIQEPQPLWVEFTNFEFSYFAQQSVTGQPKLYCVNIDGEVHERLNKSVQNDSGSAIESRTVIGWFHPEDPGIYSVYNALVFYAYLETWSLDITVDTFKIGDYIPEELDGLTGQVTGSTGGAVVGSAVVGTSITGNIGIKTQKLRSGLRGNYLSIELKNLNVDEYTEIQRISVYYRNIHTE